MTPDPRLDQDEWRTYDEFAAGIDTYRLPAEDLTGRRLRLTLDGGGRLDLRFHDAETVEWERDAGPGSRDPYDAVAVRPDVHFVNVPLPARRREALTLVWSGQTGRAVAVHSAIAAHPEPDVPQVGQRFCAGTVDGVAVSGPEPGPSRDLIGRRNVYRYSPSHLYEHVYLSGQRYAWQCLQGVQRGHGDVDLSTVWRFDGGLYLFCFREFKIPVASVWLHDLGYQLMTTGIFLGLDGTGEVAHSRAGGYIYPLGSVTYPDIQPV
ncbi:molybdenum cofactor biosynthesis F family protein [Pseudonocardia eucalypti]|uniref:Molybdenum cofactor biosynthesis F family protein n=1 Tax=Pseudonocardia eucalypti TaxID=648755 RepID=A0ABP9QGN9_9PSEU|nr:hypothetical protein [Pseudonocardia eucalypti]